MSATMEERVINTLKASGKTALQKNILIKKSKVKKTEIKYLDEALAKLVKEGKVFRDKTSYVLSEKVGLVPADVVRINESFGFVHCDGDVDDTFVAGRFLLGAMPGDRVLVRKYKSQRGGDKEEGEVVLVIDEAEAEISGTFVIRNSRGYIMPDRLIKSPIEVLMPPRIPCKDGDKVTGKIVKRGNRHFNHRASITENFGKAEDAKSSCKAILKMNDISTEFSPEVLAEAKKVSQKKITDNDFSYRLNLTDEIIFTIDGADTKDIDDAISLTKAPDGFYLGVHIADVSNYLRPGSEMDKEAYKRGTSIYYADSVIPMLPKELSNGICSLNPGEDRLALSALITLNNEGEILGYNFKKSIIRSRVKGVYSEINKIYDGSADEAILKKYDGLIPTLEAMRELAKILNQKRKNKGGFNLESGECKIILDDEDRIVDIVPIEQGESEGIIEEFMICANEAAATMAMKADLPFVYRIHEKPPLTKVETLKEICSAVGLDTSSLGDKLSAADLAGLLKKSAGTSSEVIMNHQVLRTMAKARYEHKNVGHFGLVLDNYAHFTAPIRRYPDVIVHRIISDYISGMNKGKIVNKFEKYVPTACKHVSACELTAMTIERDCEDCYKAEFMKDKIGDTFEGVVSSVAPQGVYVELPNTIEGLVHMADIGEGGFSFDGRVSAINEKSGGRFTVGDKVKVRCIDVNVSCGNIDFDLLSTPTKMSKEELAKIKKDKQAKPSPIKKNARGRDANKENSPKSSGSSSRSRSKRTVKSNGLKRQTRKTKRTPRKR